MGSEGTLAQNSVEALYVRAKRYSAYPSRITQFWVNLQLGCRVTRKPMNLRMGKGKGTLRGLRARIFAGAWLVAFTRLRRGLLRQLAVYARVRFVCNVLLQSECVGGALCPPWFGRHQKQRRYLSTYYYEGCDLFRQARQPQQLAVLRTVFRWRWRRPQATQRLRRRTGFTLRKLCRRYSLYTHPHARAVFVRYMGLRYFAQMRERCLGSRAVWLAPIGPTLAPAGLLEQVGFDSFGIAYLMQHHAGWLWRPYLTPHLVPDKAAWAVLFVALRVWFARALAEAHPRTQDTLLLG